MLFFHRKRPDQLIEQLASGGKMIIPVGASLKEKRTEANLM